MDNDVNPGPVNQVSVSNPQETPRLTTASRKYLPIVIAAGLILLIAGFIALKVNKKQAPVTQQASTAQPNHTKNNKQHFTAQKLADYGQVCKGGVAINATPYQDGPRPHPITLFTQSRKDTDDVSELYLSFKNREWQTNIQKVETAQLVGCFKYKSEGASKKCEYSRITLDYFAVTYELTVREAKTGKTISTKEVPGPNLTCPSYTSYELDDPKIYAKPDPGLTEEAVKEYVTR